MKHNFTQRQPRQHHAQKSRCNWTSSPRRHLELMFIGDYLDTPMSSFMQRRGKAVAPPKSPVNPLITKESEQSNNEQLKSAMKSQSQLSELVARCWDNQISAHVSLMIETCGNPLQVIHTPRSLFIKSDMNIETDFIVAGCSRTHVTSLTPSLLVWLGIPTTGGKFFEEFYSLLCKATLHTYWLPAPVT